MFPMFTFFVWCVIILTFPKQHFIKTTAEADGFICFAVTGALSIGHTGSCFGKRVKQFKSIRKKALRKYC